MQRQSIGSPSRSHAVAGDAAPTVPEVEEVKPEKPIKPSYTTERTVHLIPVLTLLCLLILYLNSHDPSIKDLANFDGALPFIHPKVVTETGRYEGGGVGAIVNHRGLKADLKLRNRKLGSDKE